MRPPTRWGCPTGSKHRLIVLPQAIRHVIPPLVNTFIGFFKDTSLVLIIGIFDLLTDGQDRDHRSGLAALQRRGLHLRRRDLFCLLLCDVALQPRPGGEYRL